MPSEIVEVRRESSIAVAVVRRRARAAELSRVVPECCGLVWKALKSQGVHGGRNVAIYLDGEINLEVGVELAEGCQPGGELVLSATPAGAVAHVRHLGPYGSLGRAHDAIHEWSRTAHRRLAGPSWELYGHWQEAWSTDPSGILTDVYYLLAEA